MPVRFDDSLPQFVNVLSSVFGKDVLADSAIVRDAGGRLSAVLPIEFGSSQQATAEAELHKVVGAYARPDGLLIDASSPGAAPLLREARSRAPSAIGELRFRLLDRRIVGSDWLMPPARSATKVPRVVFTSLKGGVGRSTALCVLAAHMSRHGQRVLAVDFDLEAPGIGTMLLHERELPPFGTLDYLVENGLSGVDEAFMADLAGDSFIGSEGARVTVVPAIGRRTIDNPSNALAKIARAYLENPTADGDPISLSGQFRQMIERFENTAAYDIVMIDARAGLHETTASAILALGGEVLLFGIDHPQTYLGYQLLMAHLANFAVDPEDDWRDRLHFVIAKASDSSKVREGAIERFSALYELVNAKDRLADRLPEALTAEDFDIEWNDNADIEVELFTPPPVLYVLDDARYRDFDPTSDRDLLVSTTYGATFASLIEYADTVVEPSGPSEP
jgi:Mrp family chromosome partitioning ATPase